MSGIDNESKVKHKRTTIIDIGNYLVLMRFDYTYDKTVMNNTEKSTVYDNFHILGMSAESNKKHLYRFDKASHLFFRETGFVHGQCVIVHDKSSIGKRSV